MTTTTTVPESAPARQVPGRAVLAFLIVGALLAVVALAMMRDGGSPASPALTGARVPSGVVGSADALERHALSSPPTATPSADALEGRAAAARTAASGSCVATGGSADTIERCLARVASHGG